MQNDFLRILESAIQFGWPVLLQGVSETLDPILEPVLARSLTKKGGRWMIKLGEKEIDYSPDFKLIMTTRLANPVYSPEIFAQVTVINFTVKEQGLENQCLGLIVRSERADLEDQKSRLVQSMAAAKKTLLDLEDQILHLLSTAQGSLLDDVVLVNTLQSSKTTSQQVHDQLLVSAETEARIDAAREQYRPAAVRSSILYFCLNDLAAIDTTYQFSLDAYLQLFDRSLPAAESAYGDAGARVAGQAGDE
ncbi:hypothetical protein CAUPRSCDRAFT_12653 [Caulochytrium protostelioides]|uniref:Dynein heavy chain ATP-binding dynein motor region domain-containing protein n=1 Tax=Caulochytrium protostelioides TaxID=1555241 RepID=A0A4P9WRC9_9FUNG|nr:hypothetical protein CAUPRSCDRAFT_12653 [Caulochytrium protostelioides]